MPAPMLDLRSVQEGAPVATADGRRLGTVGNILRDLPELVPVEVGQPGVFATSMPGGYGAGENVYFKVDPDGNKRHSGVSGYYVPLMAVAEAGEAGMRLSYTAEEVPHDEWARPPESYPGT